jgi:phosphoglycerate dehydrogenase-like enzyme
MLTIRKVLCTVPFAGQHKEQLQKCLAPAEIIFCAENDDEMIQAALRDVDVAIVRQDLDDRFIAAPNLKWVHCGHSGLTRSARPEVFDKGLVVTGSAGRSAAALAQHAFYFALALTFNARKLFENQARHVWRCATDAPLHASLAGKTVGIVGFGHTGKEMASLGRAFQMKVIAFNRSARPASPLVDKMWSSEEGETLDELIATSDVIMLATQLTDETYHLFSTAEFQRMKPSAFIINMARGDVIDEDALIHALRNGEIAGAGLDVFSREPLPEDSQLWDIPNVVITPHQTPALPDKEARALAVLLENVRRYRDEQPMLNALRKADVFTKGH